MPMRSKAQRRWMWATHPVMAERWEEHTPTGKKLPEKVHHKKHAFITGLSKTAVMDLSEEARYSSIAPFQDYVKGSNLDKDTGQRRKGNLRTQNVRNEDKEFTPAIKHDVDNARRPKLMGR